MPEGLKYDFRSCTERDGQITHHIDGDVDAERDKLLKDLQGTGFLSQVHWMDDFHEQLEGRNDGGDAYTTDGRRPASVISLPDPGDGE